MSNKPSSKYTNFDGLTYDEKNEKIYSRIISVTSKEWLANKILEKFISISPSRKWKDSIGCPIIKIEGITYREINNRFPLQKVSEVLRQKFMMESFENEST